MLALFASLHERVLIRLGGSVDGACQAKASYLFEVYTLTLTAAATAATAADVDAIADAVVGFNMVTNRLSFLGACVVTQHYYHDS